MKIAINGAAGSHQVALLRFPLKVTDEGQETGETTPAPDINFYHQNVKTACPWVTFAAEKTVASDLFLLHSDQ